MIDWKDINKCQPEQGRPIIIKCSNWFIDSERNNSIEKGKYTIGEKEYEICCDNKFTHWAYENKKEKTGEEKMTDKIKELKTNEGTQTFIARIPCIIFSILSFILLFNGIKGWGWFIFMAFASSCRVSFNKDEEAEDE